MAIGLLFLFRSNKVPLGPQQRVITTNPKLGVHTRLTDEVEPQKIKQTLEMVREMGATWIVEYFPWAYIEPEAGQFNWAHADLVVDHANRQGLTVIARIGYVPEWARPKESSPLYLDEPRFDDFGRFAAEFAKHYAGRVRYMIIWNEPNLSLEWGYERPDVTKYVNMLHKVNPLIKAANPEMQVLAGALAPTFDNGDVAINDLTFLRQMYQLGAADWFDILAAHAYGWHFPPDDPPAEDVINFRRVELLRQIMVEAGDADSPIMITEGGWNDHPRWTRAVRPAQRIEYTIRAYEIAQTQWPWLESISFWAFRFPWDAKSYQDYFTFVRTDFEPKPIYEEIQRYTSGKDGS
ncbi:MAG: beta-galactosidase [Caldilineaceae bacterium]